MYFDAEGGLPRDVAEDYYFRTDSDVAVKMELVLPLLLSLLLSLID